MTLSTSAVAVCCCSDSLRSSRARLHLVEQPHVLDRDHRLVGEGREQLDLLVGERLNLGAGQMTITPIGVPSRKQRHADDRAKAAEFLRIEPDVFRVGQDVGDVN